jgi:putative ABC transport system permease protein
MNMIKLSLSNLRFHSVSSFFNMLILALGIATIVTLLHVSSQVEQRLEADLKGFDLVIGAKGSPIQLILSSVFHLDIPNGNIPLKEAERISKNPLIKSAIPLALGDNYHNFRIVGTTPDYAKHYEAILAEGTYWKTPMEVVLGSEVARISGMKLGQSFSGSHGLTAGGEEHSDFPYRVVGILQPTGTVIDRLVLTDVGSVWNIHEHDKDEPVTSPTEREITSLLVSYKSPAAAVTLPRMINKTSSLQAASPAFEMARLIKIIGIGSDAITVLGGVLILIAAIGFFVTLFNAINDHRYDIALMRSLGATRQKVFAFVLTEGLILGSIGTAAGIALGHGFVALVMRYISESKHMQLSGLGFHPYEAYIVLGALGISITSAIIPAIMAYKINVAKILSKGS